MIYFDNAATTMKKPACVIKAVSEAMTTLGNDGRGVHEGALSASRVIYHTRCKLAKLFGVQNPERIAFTLNATYALNIALKGTLQPKDHVITTQLEHNSILRPLYELQAQGVELSFLPADRKGTIDVDEIETLIRPNTKVIVTTHASNLTGNVVDIQKIAQIAKKHQLLYIVDASQSAGILPIDVTKMGIDILCFTGHKGLLGPQGTGGIYVREGIEIRPLVSGGSGVQSYSHTHPSQMPTALEAGTLNGHGIAGLGAALDYIQEIGLDTIRTKEQSLMWYFYHQVKEIPGICVYGDFTSKERCAIVALNIRDYDSGMVSDVLFEEYGIATRPGAHCAPLMHQALETLQQGAIRFSFSHYNTKEEIDIAILALKRLAQEE